MSRFAAGLARVATAAAAVGILGLLSASSVSAGDRTERLARGYTSPSRVVAAQVAMAQLAQRKGQWAALRDTAASNAILFTPRPVLAHDWLKGHKTGAVATSRQPHQVWMSCDGSLAVSYGAQQWPDGSPGYFTTIWQRQKDGRYKWVMDDSDRLAAPIETPEMIGSRLAPCQGRGAPAKDLAAAPSHAVEIAPGQPGGAGGWSNDRTLSWSVALDGDCGRALTVHLARSAGEPMEAVLQKRIAPSRNSQGQPAMSCTAP